MNSLHLVESMAALSARMRELAEDNNWAALAGLDAEFAALRDALAEKEPAGAQSGDISAAEGLRKAALIRQILADHGVMRAEAEPALASTRRLLSPNTVGQSMRAAYGAQRG